MRKSEFSAEAGTSKKSLSSTTWALKNAAVGGSSERNPVGLFATGITATVACEAVRGEHATKISETKARIRRLVKRDMNRIVRVLILGLT
jgi:hypothetical protein